uniref:Putative secreted peptide n=1 Tax=Anopheles braziliensis TaxID=58242 RepID=A0A2M3ZSC6_9DIPT
MLGPWLVGFETFSRLRLIWAFWGRHVLRQLGRPESKVSDTVARRSFAYALLLTADHTFAHVRGQGRRGGLRR